jgi:N-acetylated-alpha-linked acidic dipeptidase
MQLYAERATDEDEIVNDVEVGQAWGVVEQFATLVRESGTEQELQAVGLLTAKLDEWGVPYTLHRPELLISLPRGARMTIGDRIHRAKTPSMSASTPAGGLSADLVYRPGAFGTSVSDLFDAVDIAGDVDGKLVLTEGLPMPAKVSDLERRGAVGVVFIAPGERIHEGICTPVWGSPDLQTQVAKPTIPVISVSKPDGEALIEELRTNGSLPATIEAEHEERWREIPVLVTEIQGTVEPEQFVLVHGHIDSWHVGIGDNATGDATLLELARVLHKHRDKLARSVRIAWWSGHSHGRYAGSTWYADAFANDLLRNCIVHVNCDSPGCRDAIVYEDVFWMAEAAGFAKQVIGDVAGVAAEGRQPARAGDISFNNLGISTFLMLSSNIPATVREERGLYAVGGCGGNIEWHTEADELDVADRDNLLRDIKVYATAAVRAANLPVHPLDYTATVAQLRDALDRHAEALDGIVDLSKLQALAAETESALARFQTGLGSFASVEAASSANRVLRAVGRQLVSVLYSRAGRFRQDPALEIPLLPELAAAAAAKDAHHRGVIRTEATRAANRVEDALLAVLELVA